MAKAPDLKMMPRLGPLERQVLETLWSHGASTVTGVLETLDPSTHHAYTTIMTILVRLHEKGLVSRTREGRAYRYRPTLTREDFLARAGAALIREFSATYGSRATVHFADALSRLPRRERAQLRRRLDELLDENG